jgi:DNA helicase-2/ATP-dependent DNA helicase PcrA
MFRFTNIPDFYKDFYRWMKREDMLKSGGDGPLEYADVFPMIYCKIRLEGMQTYDHVKHLLIDEMQDYTPIQYAVLSRIFHCRKTILGDVSQTVNPYSASSAETIEEVFPQGEMVRLQRSYRSTVEITAFAQRIRNNPQLIPLERHGEQPGILAFNSKEEERAGITTLVDRFRGSSRKSMAIICKTQRQATELFQGLKPLGASLLTADSTLFTEGIVVTSAHLAKGLEFDEVLIPYASANNYQADIDRSMLYIACTRAMHRLVLTHTGALTDFISPVL